jgi:DNA-binding SARP family transcriptional activator
METHDDQSGALGRPGIDDVRLAGARSGLSEAVAELQRLISDPLFRATGRALADLGGAPGGSGVSIETVRMLRQWRAEHLRVADELEIAARRCRLVEAEIGQRIDALLAGWDREPESAGAHDQVMSPADTQRRNGRDGWLREIFRRDHADRDWPAGGLDSARRERRPVPVISASAPAVRPDVLPAPAPVPAAGVTRPATMGGMPAAGADVAALVLGPLEVSVAGGRVLRWSSLKARAVFQYLLIHQDRPVRRDLLMELEWPDHTRNSARNNLNVALYSLRNTIDRPRRGIQPILYRDGCYLLNPELTWWIDRSEFLSALDRAALACRREDQQQAIDAYQEAVRLYRGQLFEDDSAGEWFLPEQRRLTDRYLRALGHLAEIHCDRGEFNVAIQSGQLAINADPCCEPAHRVLMRCYARQNQQQLVSRQYRWCVDALRAELGVLPGAETVQLFRALTTAS